MYIKIIEEKAEFVYTISRALITRYSRYFAEEIAASKTDVRVQTKTFVLRDTSVRQFELLVKWLAYQRHRHDDRVEYLSRDIYDWAKLGPLFFWETVDQQEASIDAYILGSRFDIPQLRVDATDRLVKCAETITDHVIYVPAHVQRAYDSTHDHSLLRKCLVDTYSTTRFDRKGNRGDLTEYPKEFLVDVMYRNATVFTAGHENDVVKLDRCDYHGHKSQEGKERCRLSRIPQ